MTSFPEARSHHSAWAGFESTLYRTSLSKFDIQKALPRLQHDFCALWNEPVQEVWRSEYDSIAIHILISIRRSYINLHRGTYAAPTAFSASTAGDDVILRKAPSYSSCNHPDHRPHFHEVVGTTGDTISAVPIVT